MKKTLLVLLCVLASACTSVRQVAIVADQSFATAVFALDDAEYQACQSKVLSEAQCTALDGPIKQALVDVKAVSQAIKASPKDGVPVSLPALLRDLGDVQAVIAAMAPVLPDISAKAYAANSKAIELLNKLIGG